MAKKVKPFAGKETYAEELAEAKEVKSGKISPSKFAKSEVKEEKGRKRFAAGGSVNKADGVGKARGTGAATKGTKFNGVW